MIIRFGFNDVVEIFYFNFMFYNYLFLIYQSEVLVFYIVI